MDIAVPENNALIQNMMKIKEAPPLILAFQELATSNGGRPALFMQVEKSSVQMLKTAAADLLPKVVHVSKNQIDFDKIKEAAKEKKLPLIGLFAPKLSPNPTSLVKACSAILRGVANFTLVDYSTEGGKEIINSFSDKTILNGSIERNETFVLGLDSSSIEKSNETTISPDSVQEFAIWFKQLRTKQQGDKSKKTSSSSSPPQLGVYHNMTQKQFDSIVYTQNSPVLCVFGRNVNESSMPANWTTLTKAASAKFGLSTMLIFCNPNNQSNNPHFCSDSSSQENWVIKGYTYRKDEKTEKTVISPKTLSSGIDQLEASLLNGEKTSNTKIEVITDNSISSYLQRNMASWAVVEHRKKAKVAIIYIDNEEELSSTLVSIQASTKSFADFVYLKKPTDEVLKSIYLDPSKVFLPLMVAYLPNLEEFDKEPEVAVKSTGKKGQQKPKEEKSMSFRVIPFDGTRIGQKTVTFETGVLFALDAIRHLDSNRWEKFFENEIEVAFPYEFAGLVRQSWLKSQGGNVDGKIPLASKAFDRESFENICKGEEEDVNLCLTIFIGSDSDASREKIVDDARLSLEKSGLGSGLRIALIDGSCHYRVVESLGGDPTMLPVVSLWNVKKNTYSMLKGTFSVDSITLLVRTMKKGLGIQSVQGKPFESFTPVQECYSKENQNQVDGGAMEEEDDLMKELREEAEREQKAKELAKKEAEAEAKRLKQQREAELKAQREKMNKVADKEQSNKKKKEEL